METIRIESPRDEGYPFSRELYDDLHVVYQGTSSIFSSRIEADGFILGHIPFPLEAIRRLAAICERVGHKGWFYTTVKGLSTHTQLNRGNVSCSQPHRTHRLFLD